MTKITITCCGGTERYPGHCIQNRCPKYRIAKAEVDRSWPWLPTGYGNAYGNPTHSHYLARVNYTLSNKKKD